MKLIVVTAPTFFCGRRQDYHGTIRRGAGYSTSEEAGNSRHVFRTAFNADTRKIP